MPIRIASLLLLTGLVVWSSSPAPGAEPSRILFVTQSKGFVHGSVKRKETLAPAEIALTQLGEQSRLFRVDCTQDCEADFTRENLENYDIVAFYSSGDLPIAPADLEYFFSDWLRQSGHGVLGFHSALDTFHNYEPYWDMIGGTFIRHPWTSGSTVTLVNHEPENPVVAPYGESFVVQDEIYMYRQWQPEKVHVLLSLDYSRSLTDNPVPTQFGYHVPVCWVKEYGHGRVYVNNLGHNEQTWTNKAVLASITEAVRWIQGHHDINAAPNPDVSAAQESKARKDFVTHGFIQDTRRAK